MTRVALTGPTAGELSPKLIGRPDLVRYATGARVIENMIVHPTGPWEFREGFRYKGKPKNADKRARPVPFIFSDEQAYVLEFGDFYVRFWKDGGLIAVASVPVEVATPWSIAQVLELGFTQSADVLFIFHPDFAIRALTRTSHTDWTLSEWELRDGPYQPQNLSEEHKITRSTTTGDITFTVAGFPHATDPEPFVATDVGAALRVYDKGSSLPSGTTAAWLWCKIKTVIDGHTVVATLQPDQRAFAGDNPTIDWRLGLFGETRKWPGCGTIHEQRLWLAGARQAPDRAYASVIGDYHRFSPDTTAADGIGIAAATPQVDRIKAMVPLNDVIAFSGGAEIRIGGTSERAAIEPTGVSAKPLSTYGSANVQPVPYGNGVFFVDKQGRRLRSYTYDQDIAGYRGDDLTLLADHIPGPRKWGGLDGLAYQANPLGIIWVIRSDGTLAGCTYARVENVQAWHRHLLGGDADCEGLCVIPGPTDDELWGIFRRTVNGADVRTMERYEPSDFVETPPEERCHLDMALTLDNKPAADLTLAALSGAAVTADFSANILDAGDVGRYIVRRYEKARDDDNQPVWGLAVAQITAVGAANQATVKVATKFPFDRLAIDAGEWRLSVSQITGLTPYIGMTLTVVGDAKVLGDFVISNDALDLPQPAGIVHVGLRYTGRMRTLPLDGGAPPGTLQGRPQRLPRAVLRVLKSIGGRYGTRLDKLGQLAPYETVPAPMQPPEAVSKDHKLVQASDWGGAPAQWIIQDQPLPLNGVLLVPDVYQPMVQP